MTLGQFLGRYDAERKNILKRAAEEKQSSYDVELENHKRYIEIHKKLVDTFETNKKYFSEEGIKKINEIITLCSDYQLYENKEESFNEICVLLENLIKHIENCHS